MSVPGLDRASLGRGSLCIDQAALLQIVNSILTAFLSFAIHIAVPPLHTGLQRAQRQIISSECKARLDEVGFVWDALEERWENDVAALTKFKEREGHCEVPYRHIEGLFKLGGWVANQRQRQREGTLSPARKARLDALGFRWHSNKPSTAAE